MDIYIEETEGSKKSIRIPWLPEKIQIIGNGSRLASYEIVNLGEFNLPNGKNLREFRWESKLPGAKHSNLPFLRSWLNPKIIQNTFELWKNNNTPLRLTITETPISQNVYITDFNVIYEGAYGDYSYDIVLKDRRDDIVIKVAKGKNSAKSTTPVDSGTKSYTIKGGDTLWAIAVNFFGKSKGKLWTEIYNSNKEIIEATAKKHGKKNSGNGHWIYPGTTLKIPNK